MGVVLAPKGLEVGVGDRLLPTTLSLLQRDDVSFKVVIFPVQEQVVDFLLLLEERQLLQAIVHTVGRDHGHLYVGVYL